MSTNTTELGTTQAAAIRRPSASSSDPSMDEALRRARRIDALDKAAHVAASYVRRPAMTP